jgi:hypothetical protein
VAYKLNIDNPKKGWVEKYEQGLFTFNTTHEMYKMKVEWGELYLQKCGFVGLLQVWPFKPGSLLLAKFLFSFYFFEINS